MNPEQLAELNEEVQRIDRQTTGSVYVDVEWCNKAGMGVDVTVSYTWDNMAGEEDD